MGYPSETSWSSGLEVTARHTELRLTIAGLFVLSSWAAWLTPPSHDYSPFANSFGSKPLPCLSMKYTERAILLARIALTTGFGL